MEYASFTCLRWICERGFLGFRAENNLSRFVSLDFHRFRWLIEGEGEGEKDEARVKKWDRERLRERQMEKCIWKYTQTDKQSCKGKSKGEKNEIKIEEE